MKLLDDKPGHTGLVRFLPCVLRALRRNSVWVAIVCTQSQNVVYKWDIWAQSIILGYVFLLGIFLNCSQRTPH